MNNFELRDYQKEDIDRIWSLIDSGHNRIMYQLSTGGGKTICSSALIHEAHVNRNWDCIFTVPRISLVNQTVEKFNKSGLDDVGVIQANHILTDYSKPVQVASVSTLARRQIAFEKGVLDPKLFIIDEAHMMYSFIGDILKSDEYKDIPIVGLSATPYSRGLGNLYTKLVQSKPMKWMINKGYLSNYRVYAPSHPDLSGVKTLGGDYKEDDLSNAMSNTTLVADIVDTWLKLGENRPTICFAVTRAHARFIQEEFIKVGVKCEYVDAFTEIEEREQIERRFHSGETKIVCSVGCLTTGIDWDVRCIILARPTKSDMLYQQMIGRGLRIAEGKEDCLILDHSDTTLNLGFVDDIIYDELDTTKPGERQKKRKPEKDSLPKECPECGALRKKEVFGCDECGWKPKHKKENVNVIAGQLVEIGRNKTKKRHTKQDDRRDYNSNIKKEWYLQLCNYAIERGYKPGWVSFKYKEAFGSWPDWEWRKDAKHYRSFPPKG